MLEEIGAALHGKNIATPAVDLFYNSMPSSPDICTTLYQTGGFEPGLNFDKSSEENPTFQVMCRGTSQVETNSRIQSIYKYLHGNSDIFPFIQAMQSPEPLGRDSNNRWEFSCNFKIIKEL